MNMPDNLTHILSKINKAMVSKAPFDHFIIHDFLPQDLYNRLVQASDKLSNDDFDTIEKIEIVDEGECKPTPENIHKAGTITYNMYKASNIHKEICLLLSTDDVKEAIFNRFGITDEARGGPELIREVNINLRPHTDVEQVNTNYEGLLLNFQVYCPIDDSHPKLGVKLLKKFKAFNVANSYMTVKTVPFIPNIAWCIKPSNDSWHSVDPIKNLTDFNRDSLMMRYYKLTIK